MGQPVVNGFPSSAISRNLALNPWRSAGPSQRSAVVDLTVVMRRRTESVQHLEPFSDMTSADCTTILASAKEQHYTRSFTVFSEEKQGDEVLLLLSGCLKVTQRGANDQEVILRLNGPGEFVGGVTEGTQNRSSLSARAVQTSSALVWQTSAFRAALDRFPILRRNVSRGLERQLEELDTRFREISTEKVASRLCSLLVRLGRRAGRNAEGRVELCLSRQELAQLTGTTLFTVSRLLCKWESQGILSARREAVQLNDVPALQELSQQE